MVKGVYFAHVPSPKIRGIGKTDLQFKTAQSISPASQISSSQSASSASLPPKIRLHGKIGHFSSLLPRASCRASSKISVSGVQRSGLQHDVPPIRPGDSSFSLFKNQQLVGRSFSSVRDKGVGILGRLPHRTSGCSNPAKACQLDTRLLRVSGLGSKPKKVGDYPNKKARVPGNHLGHREEPEDSTGRQESPYSECYRLDPGRKQVELAERDIAFGPTQLCSNRESTRSTFLEEPAKSNLTASGTQTEREKSGPIVSGKRLCLVETEHSPVESIIPRSPDSILDNRCVRKGLGISLERRVESGSVVTGAESVACEPQRTLHRADSSQGIQEGVAGQVSDVAVRQQDCSGLHQEAGRHPVQDSAGSGQGDLGFEPPSSNSSGSFLSAGSLQLLGGQVITGNASHGLAPGKQRDTADIQEVGKAPDRSVRHKTIEGSRDVCHAGGQRQRSCVHQRVQQDLECGPSLGISPSSTDTRGFTPPELSERSVSDCGTSMGEDFLAERAEEQELGSSFRVTEPGALTGGFSDRRASPERERPVFGGLANTGWADLVSGLSSSDVDLVSSAWRSSTWKTYGSAWKQWTKWCAKNQVPPGQPTGQQLASYLGFLANERKLGYRTILTKKSVVSSLANPGNENRLSAHPLVRSMVKAIGNREAAKSTAKSSIWNVELLIEWLKSHPPDQNSLFQVSRHTAILLLLASGRRVHDLTLLAIGENNYVSQRDSVTFWPIFGSKTDSVRHRQSGWKLSRSKQQVFNLVFWVKRLIEVSAERRKAVPGLLKLFITTRGKVAEASKAIVAGWLKTIFKDLNINTSPGSIRSAVASYRYEQGMELDEILKRGNWQGAKNFFKYYCKEVQRPKSRSQNQTVLSVFEPVK